jgi:hypothetical protein
MRRFILLPVCDFDDLSLLVVASSRLEPSSLLLIGWCWLVLGLAGARAGGRRRDIEETKGHVSQCSHFLRLLSMWREARVASAAERSQGGGWHLGVHSRIAVSRTKYEPVVGKAFLHC